jgi:hypothetical protein
MTRLLGSLLAFAAALGAAPAAGAPALQVSTRTTPQRALFGDVIHATITVRASAVATVQGGFSPYAVLGSRSTSSRSGGVVTTTWTFALQCLQPQCAPGPGARRIALAPSRVLVGARVVTARFSRVVVDTRATAAQVAHPERSFLHPTTPPAPTYRFAPETMRRLLFAAAGLLVLLAAVLFWPLVRRRSRSTSLPERDSLAHALALVRAARSRPPPDRRRALGLLARTLRRQGEAQVARDAADLAWSEPDPDAGRMETLAERVEGSR